MPDPDWLAELSPADRTDLEAWVHDAIRRQAATTAADIAMLCRFHFRLQGHQAIVDVLSAHKPETRRYAEQLLAQERGQPRRTARVSEPTTGREFLDRFEQRHRSTVANIFHRAVREGAGTVSGVLDAVRDDAAARLANRWTKDEWRADLQRLGREIGTPAAAAYAQYVINYEALSQEEKDRLKAERGEQFKSEWMGQQPPTHAQLEYLRKLGYSGPLPVSKADASKWIDRLRGTEGR